MTVREAISAATVVIFRRAANGGAAEVLMVERSRTLVFAGGAAVFPGGRVDPGDRELALRIGRDEDLDDAAARIAAIRETLEETGLVIGMTHCVTAENALEARALLSFSGKLQPVLDRFGWTLDLSLLHPFARWLPEGALVRTFDTRFYLADLGTGSVDLAVDGTENDTLFWASASDVLDRADLGDLSIIFPTRCNLQRLALLPDFSIACAQAERTPPRTVTPWFEGEGAARMLCIPDDLGYPVTKTPIDAVHRG